MAEKRENIMASPAKIDLLSGYRSTHIYRRSARCFRLVVAIASGAGINAALERRVYSIRERR
jgi:hypothetical protein